jgi:16S rRNA (cytosine967-C5)-methyltransferase
MSRPDRSGPPGESGRDAAKVAAKHPRRQLPQGYLARALATRLIGEVLIDGHALDDATARVVQLDPYRGLAQRDLAFARLVAATAIRRSGEIEAVIGSFLEHPLPEHRGILQPILHAAAAQLLFLQSPPHAVINVAVEQCRRDRRTRRFARLANAVLRRIAEKGAELLASQGGVRLSIPDWLWQRWVAAYGLPVAERIASASLQEAALDLTVKSNAQAWVDRLGARLLPTGSIRLRSEGRVEALAGYADGAWWVQDAAAALPARLLGAVAGQKIADLCAAPGGKTAQLAAMGAEAWAVDVSHERLVRLKANLDRLNLDAAIVAADAASWAPGIEFDGVLLDVPCLSTGTIRRHPDILRLKRPGDLPRLIELQTRLLRNALSLVKAGGRLVYCCCSLEPEEGPEQIGRALAEHPEFARVPIEPAEIGADPQWITPQGDLRTLPFHMQLDSPGLGGMDGFFAARLERRR